jgi:Domain of unknown function (DUF4184)
MAFTISHTAVVLPFSRPLARWRLLSATVIGSMVPDFGLFMPLRPARFETHSLPGLFIFCLPVGLATYWIFQRLMKIPLVELLPDGAYSRWRDSEAPAEFANLRQWIMAACGVLAGAVTHLVWDAFTHEGARGVRMMPALDDLMVGIGGHHLGGARLLQDASSLVGLVVVVAILAYGLRPGRGVASAAAPRRLRAGERRAWIAAYMLSAAALTGAFFLMRRPESAAHSAALPVGGAAIAVLRGVAAALLIVSLGLNLRLRRLSPQKP